MSEKSKDERLAEALRNNLRRRKQQAREVDPVVEQSARPVLSGETGSDEQGGGGR